MMEKALVVDADFLMSGYAVESLRREGLIVLEAASAAEAARLQAEHDFDIVFADLEMVGSNGGIFAGETVLVVTTSFRTVEKAIALVKNGAYDYLVKPFSEEQVSVIVTRARELFKLRERIGNLEKEQPPPMSSAPASESVSAFTGTQYEPQTNNLHELERRTIMRVFQETGGSRNRMAEILGISVRTLRNKLVRYKNDTLLQA